MIQVGIIGSTGYAGQQLVHLLMHHSHVNINFLVSHNYSSRPFHEVYPQYEGLLDHKCIDLKCAYEKLSSIDVLFLALPSGYSFDIVKKALSSGVKVIDLGSDYRLKDKKMYKDWYDLEHEASNLLSSSVYGLCEINKKTIKKASLIANPGCYPTASILALAPLFKYQMIHLDSLIIDAKSGVSGAGRSAKIGSLFAECNESFKAYGVSNHRHTPEIEQMLSSLCKEDVLLNFTPHLIPMNRGILSTCYANLKKSISQDELHNLYEQFYEKCRFIRVRKNLPETRWVKGTNFCDMHVSMDARTNRVIVVSVIDNLIKGAAGQAIQNMNILFDLDETTGLPLLSMSL